MPSQSTPRKSAGNGGGGGRRRASGGKGGGGGPNGGSQQSSSVLGSPSSTSSSSDLRAKLAKAAEIETKLSSAAASASSSASKSKSSNKVGGGGGGSGGGPSTDQDSKLIRMYMELCELLSDVLLSDPSLAARKDAAGRLWRGCFYGRIGELRGRIQRERNRARRCAGRGDKAGASRHGKAAEELEGNFRTFLEEAVVLYEYLVDKHREMLTPPPSQSQSLPSSQGSEGPADGGPQSQDSAAAKGYKKRRGGGGSNGPVDLRSSHLVPTGVVPTLHKMYIHLGDLYRYAKSYGKAERSYALSSRLAPGKGNPYNQLAVVAQLRGDAAGQQQQDNGNGSGGKGGQQGGGGQQCPQTAVALYWYARSLRATGEPFPTSRSNLARLFSVNRQWLEKSGEASLGPATLSLSAEEGNNKGKGGGGPGSVEILTSAKAQTERARAVKSAQARRFLASFVDLHWDLFRGAVRSSHSPPQPSHRSADAQTAPPVSAADATLRMRSLLADFASLLEGPSMAFGDALLCKLVVVNSFACCNDEGGPPRRGDGRDSGGGSARDEGGGGEGGGRMELSNALARGFFLSFGATLAENAALAAEKLEEKRRRERGVDRGGISVAGGDMDGGAGGSVPSLRLLLPLALACEFASALYGNGDGCAMAMGMERAEDIVASSSDDGDAAAFLAEAQRSFWKNATSAANALCRSEAFLPLMLERTEGDFADLHDANDVTAASGAAMASLAVPREFDGLRGFSPFECFLPVHKSGGSGGGSNRDSKSDSQSSKKRKEAYLAPADAAEALEAYQEDCTPSKSSGGGGKANGPKNDADSRARVLRFASFVRRHMGLDESEPGTYFVRDVSGNSVGGELTCAFRTRATTSVPVIAMDNEAAEDSMDLDVASPGAVSPEGGGAAAEARSAERVAEAAVSPPAAMEEDDFGDAGGDLLVYRAPEAFASSAAAGGTGPALLVPSDLLLSGGGGVPKITTQPRIAQDNAASKLLPLQLSAGGAVAMSGTPPIAAGLLSPEALSAPPPRGALLPVPAHVEVEQQPPQLPPQPQPSAPTPAMAMAMAGLTPVGVVHAGPGIAKALPQSLPTKPPPGFSRGGAPPPPPGFGAPMGGIVPPTHHPQPQPQIQAHLPFQSQQAQPQPHHQPVHGASPSWIAGSTVQLQHHQHHQQSLVLPGIGGLSLPRPGPASTANPFASFAQGAVGGAPVTQQHQQQVGVPLGFSGVIGGPTLSAEGNDAMSSSDADDLFGLRSLGLLEDYRPPGDGGGGIGDLEARAREPKDPFRLAVVGPGAGALNLPTETRNPFFAPSS